MHQIEGISGQKCSTIKIVDAVNEIFQWKAVWAVRCLFENLVLSNELIEVELPPLQKLNLK